MKKVLILVMGLVLCVGLFANITPYGSAKLGWTLFEQDEVADQTYLLKDFGLQSNSNFGINFENESLKANVEIEMGLELRQLWAEKSFGNWSLLLGLAEDAVNRFPNQIWGNDMGLIGFGAIDGGTNPMVKFSTNDGFYASLMAPNPADALPEEEISFFLPKVNLGWDVSFNNYPIRLFPTFSLQMLMSDEDLDGHGENLMSFLLNVTAEFDLTDDMTLTANVNMGQNIGDMGYDGVQQGAVWNGEEWINTTTMGLWLNYNWRLPAVGLNAGFGMMMHSGDNYEDSETDMGIFLNAEFKLQESLFVIPEFGMFMPNADDSNKTYLGLQLRYDF